MLQLFVYKQAVKLRNKMKMESLRQSIAKADAMNGKTGRKIVVVEVGNDFEAIEKKRLKRLTGIRKGTNTRLINPAQVHKLEKRSPYVAK